MTNSKPQPVVRLQDGLLKIAVWKNDSENGTFYSVSPVTRGYKDKDGNYQDTTSLSGTQILQAGRLLGLAYDRIVELDAADYAARKDADTGTA